MSMPATEYETARASKARQATLPRATPALRPILLCKKLAQWQRWDALQPAQIYCSHALGALLASQFHTVSGSLSYVVHDPAATAIKLLGRSETANFNWSPDDEVCRIC